MFDRVLVSGAAGAGAVLAAVAVVGDPGTAVTGAVFGVVAGVAVSIRLGEGDRQAAARTGRRTGVIAGAAVTGGWLAVSGLVLVLGSAAIPVLLVLAGAAVVAWCRRWRPAPRPAPLRASPPAPAQRSQAFVPGELTTPQLCLAWQRTYFALLELPPGTPRTTLVHERERLLDELERRDPDGFTRWLDTGARAGSNQAVSSTAAGEPALGTGPGRHPCLGRRPLADPVDPQHGRAVTDALLVAAGQGDVTALAAFYDHTAPAVFGLLAHALGRTDVTERLTEQVYLDLWSAAPGFDPRGRSAYATVLFLARRVLARRIHARGSS